MLCKRHLDCAVSEIARVEQKLQSGTNDAVLENIGPEAHTELFIKAVNLNTLSRDLPRAAAWPSVCWL